MNYKVQVSRLLKGFLHSHHMILSVDEQNVLIRESDKVVKCYYVYLYEPESGKKRQMFRSYRYVDILRYLAALYRDTQSPEANS